MSKAIKILINALQYSIGLVNKEYGIALENKVYGISTINKAYNLGVVNKQYSISISVIDIPISENTAFPYTFPLTFQ